MFKVIFTLILISIYSNIFSEKIKITVWNYYLEPPFSVGDNSGLSNDFVTYINNKSDNYNYVLVTLPRSRLNRLLEINEQGIVIFVNPIWMGDNGKNHYLWTDSFLNDKNVIISHRKKPIEYVDENSLTDLTFGGILGRSYRIIDELYSKNRIKKILVDSETQVLKLLLYNRVDFTTQPLTILKNNQIYMDNKELFYIAPNELFSYERSILITKELKEIHQELVQIVNNLNSDQEWIDILRKYNLK